jgi:hypothetical protein
MLRAAELGTHRQRHAAFATFGEVVARDFAAAIGWRFSKLVAPTEIEVRECRFLRHLAYRGVERVLTRFHDTLGKVPVAIGPQEQIDGLPGFVARNYDARR